MSCVMPAKIFAVAAVAAISANARNLPVASEWAHEELTNHLAKILSKGTEGAVRLPKFEMILPGAAGSEAFADDFAALRDTDGYAVRRRGDAVCFVADNPKGHVNGVHRWLERNFDIVWPRPKNGMCFFGGADASALAAANCDYRDLPAFRIRYLGSTRDKATWKWKVRNADSVMFDCSTKDAGKLALAEKYGVYGAFWNVFGGGHDMESRWFPRREFFKDHPEYWMLVDGRRYEGKWSNFCETNPEFVKAFSRSVEEKIRNIPKSVRMVSINMEDQGLTCQCDKCLAPITLEDGTVIDRKDPAFKSTRFFIFFNQVARHIAKIRPDIRLLQFAYLHLSVPPKVKIEDNITLKLCPYPRNMRYGIVEGKANAKWKERLDGWLANTRHIYLREYYFCGCIYYPRPIADSAAVDLRYCRDRGVDAVYTDLAGRWDSPSVKNKQYDLNRPYSEFYDMVGVEAWTVCKLFWDPSLDPEELRAKYIRRSFGPAAADVAEFYRLLRESWYSDSAFSGFSDNPFKSAAHYIVKKGIADKCRAALAAAESKADCRERREWIADMRRILEDWIREAPGFISGAFDVPRLAPGNPGLDLGDGTWAAAAQMPSFKILRGSKSEDRSGSYAKIYSDGSAFWIGFDVRTGKPPRAIPREANGGFPRGDKIEVSFSQKGKDYFQFVFDCDGNRFEAKALDARWECKWDVFTQKGDTGWKAAVCIPFDAIGYAPAVDPQIKFLPVITVGDYGKTGGKQLFSWKGGLPHSPATWGTLSAERNNGSSGTARNR